MGKQAILDKIYSEAKHRADAMVGEAHAKAYSILTECDTQCRSYAQTAAAEAAAVAAEIAANARTVAELDAKKLMLDAKSKLLGRVYSLALQKITALDDKTYERLIAVLLEKAEDGDTVTVSERERAFVSPEYIEKLAREKGIKLTLDKSCGDFYGGVVLSNNKVDKNLSLEVEMSLLRESREAETARKLFG
jgi:V/A-type H+-transporting ATPase subunit E